MKKKNEKREKTPDEILRAAIRRSAQQYINDTLHKRMRDPFLGAKLL